MPQENRNVFIYLIKFLHEVLKYSSLNGTDVDLLTIKFSRVLIGGFVEDEKDPMKVAEQEVLVNMIRFLITPKSGEGEESSGAAESNSE